MKTRIPWQNKDFFRLRLYLDIATSLCWTEDYVLIKYHASNGITSKESSQFCHGKMYWWLIFLFSICFFLLLPLVRSPEENRVRVVSKMCSWGISWFLLSNRELKGIQMTARLIDSIYTLEIQAPSLWSSSFERIKLDIVKWRKKKWEARNNLLIYFERRHVDYYFAAFDSLDVCNSSIEWSCRKIRRNFRWLSTPSKRCAREKCINFHSNDIEATCSDERGRCVVWCSIIAFHLIDLPVI